MCVFYHPVSALSHTYWQLKWQFFQKVRDHLRRRQSGGRCSDGSIRGSQAPSSNKLLYDIWPYLGKAHERRRTAHPLIRAHHPVLRYCSLLWLGRPPHCTVGGHPPAFSGQPFEGLPRGWGSCFRTMFEALTCSISDTFMYLRQTSHSFYIRKLLKSIVAKITHASLRLNY